MQSSPSLIKGFLWSGVERVVPQIVQFGMSIILARMLLPDEYGLIGMLAIFFGVATTFADAGLSSGLIQSKEITKDAETSVFFMNVIAGLSLTLLLCTLSPLASKFYHQPHLTMLLCVLSLQVLISSFGIVQYALLTRNMDFKAQAIISTIATLVSGVVGIALAWKKFGVWSLVGQSLSCNLMSVTLVWIIRPWRPAGRFRWASIRSLWPFSSRLLAAGLLSTIFDNMYSIIIGRLYKPADLGYFNRASSLAQLPAGAIMGIIGRVTFPVFSRMQENKALLRVNFRKTIRILAAFHFPGMVCLAVIAGPLVRCLLTDKWNPCVPYLQVLCFSGLLYPLHAIHLNVLTALGRSDLFLKLEFIKRILMIATIAITFSYGVMAMVWGVLGLSVLCYGVNGYYTCKLIGYGWIDQGKDLLPILAASLVTGLAASSTTEIILVNDWLLLSIQLLIGIVVYGLFSFAGSKTVYADFFSISEKILIKFFSIVRT